VNLTGEEQVGSQFLLEFVAAGGANPHNGHDVPSLVSLVDSGILLPVTLHTE
jgi:hypothetical protein